MRGSFVDMRKEGRQWGSAGNEKEEEWILAV
jgi:hypothetical protein